MLKKLLQLIKQNRPQAILVAAVLLLALGGGVARADFLGIGSFAETAVVQLIAFTTNVAISFLGYLLSLVITLLISIASYNDFAASPTVTQGWVLMRDFANMGIVLALLYTAFKSVFSQNSEYNITSSLGQLVVATILINFSKTITLIFVDISQVVMMSFVNSFKGIGSGNLYKIMHLDSFFTQKADEATIGLTGAAAGMIASTFIVVIVLGVLLSMIALLVARIVAIWFLIVMSPIAMAASAMKFGVMQGVSSKWRSSMTEWLTIGPLLAFVIWLTFTSMINFTATNPPADTTNPLGTFFDFDNIMGFVFSIGMLLYGLKFAISTSGMAGEVFNKTYGLASKRLGFPEASVSGAVRFARNRAFNYAEGTLAIGRKATKTGLQLSQSQNQLAQLVGAGLKGTGTGIGKVASGTKRLGNAVRYGSVANYAGALYREKVTGQKNARADEVHHMKEHEVADKEKSYGALGDEVLQGELDHLRDGTRPEMTGNEALALLRVAQGKNMIKDSQKMSQLIDRVKEKGGGNHFIEEEALKIRKKLFPEDSIHANIKFTKDEAGHSVEDAQDSLNTIAENAGDLDFEKISIKTNLKRDHAINWKDRTDANGKVTKSVDPNDSYYQNSKAHLLSMSPESVAKNSSKVFKDGLRDHLEAILENSYDKDGKSVLSDVEVNKAMELLAASVVDSSKAKFTKNSKELDDLIKEGGVSYIKSTPSTQENANKHASTPKNESLSDAWATVKKLRDEHKDNPTAREEAVSKYLKNPTLARFAATFSNLQDLAEQENARKKAQDAVYFNQQWTTGLLDSYIDAIDPATSSPEEAMRQLLDSGFTSAELPKVFARIKKKFNSKKPRTNTQQARPAPRTEASIEVNTNQATRTTDAPVQENTPNARIVGTVNLNETTSQNTATPEIKTIEPATIVVESNEQGLTHVSQDIEKILTAQYKNKNEMIRSARENLTRIDGVDDETRKKIDDMQAFITEQARMLSNQQDGSARAITDAKQKIRAEFNKRFKS